MYELTSKYRTVHSINDNDVTRILELVPPTSRTIVDFGCHLGHLSFELALRFPAAIYAVDNFTGTAGDRRMAGTIHELTDGQGDFFERFMRNLYECRDQARDFLGEVIPVRAGEFFERVLPALSIDFAFIDSSHRVDDVWEFAAIAARINPGGVLCGHDNDARTSPGVVEGIELVAGGFDWIEDAYTWFMRKKAGAPVAVGGNHDG